MSGLQLDEAVKRQWLDVMSRVAFEAGRNSRDHGFWSTRYELEKANIPVPLKTELDNSIVAQKISLMHAELGELTEVYRKNPDGSCEKVPLITNAEEETADLLIRLMDFCASQNLRLAMATLMKMEFNAGRPHKHGRKY